MGQKFLFVHGTGVRKAGYDDSLAKIRQRLASAGLDSEVAECRWGEVYGIGSETAFSVPGYDDTGGTRGLPDADIRWNILLHNPAVEMEQLLLTTRKPAQPGTDERDAMQRNHRALCDTAPPCFVEAGFGDLLIDAVNEVQADYVLHLKDAEGFLETAPLGAVLARATVAHLVRLAATQERAMPEMQQRHAMIDAVEEVLVGESRGIIGAALKPLLAVITPLIASYRGLLTDMIRNQLGDILRYQARGEQIRAFIAERLRALGNHDVVIIAHSLGGIASLETLIEHKPHNVKALITYGSQAPLLYELGALATLPPRHPLPEEVPLWLNFFDRNDPLSYLAGELFPGRVFDHQINSGSDFSAAHGAYLDSDRMWQLIVDHLT